jgi:hypothetical protein
MMRIKFVLIKINVLLVVHADIFEADPSHADYIPVVSKCICKTANTLKSFVVPAIYPEDFSLFFLLWWMSIG